MMEVVIPALAFEFITISQFLFVLYEDGGLYAMGENIVYQLAIFSERLTAIPGYSEIYFH